MYAKATTSEYRGSELKLNVISFLLNETRIAVSGMFPTQLFCYLANYSMISAVVANT
ncbi:hypothetical Protein YC6258_00891 [Gynuella sunshinyii YC6258]|uniref:Uncharacterized protein n=1 Tax=Gynuella sunshinyii YC6258 TaxID=1445510 RepID=A0A0C5VFI5_9GAMM|nr:hypothetical Protein YC6258_00891 [Gynuella sunshinyii YC6258]